MANFTSMISAICRSHVNRNGPTCRKRLLGCREAAGAELLSLKERQEDGSRLAVNFECQPGFYACSASDLTCLLDAFDGSMYALLVGYHVHRIMQVYIRSFSDPVCNFWMVAGLRLRSVAGTRSRGMWDYWVRHGEWDVRTERRRVGNVNPNALCT